VTADAPATLVWIAPDPPGAAEARALTSWARARAMLLVRPGDEHPSPIELDLSIAENVEDLLDRAHDAVTAREGDGVDRAIATADALLRAHPELPQASWLMAEVERVRSTRWRRIPPSDGEAAERAWQRAEALDTGRVPGIGEAGSASHSPPATVAFVVPGGHRAWLDGNAAAPPVVTRAGLHALVVTVDGAPVWAEWIESPPGGSSVYVEAPAATPCSTADTTRASVIDDALHAEGVRCTRWVAATNSREPGGVRVAICNASVCGPLLDWRNPPPWTWSPPADRTNTANAPPPRGAAWPAWATWGLAGLGAAVTAGVAVVVSGALKTAPAETHFISGGLKTE
jgi:hypothetical protein